MRYTIENEFIRLTIDSLGAEMVSAVDRATGSEMIWCADPAVWNLHAPILFPYAGKLTGGHFKAADGKLYEGKQHGFARDMEHTLLIQTGHELTFELASSEKPCASVWASTPASPCRLTISIPTRITTSCLTRWNPRCA